MEVLIKRDDVEVTKSPRGCISVGYEDSGNALCVLSNELIRARDALIHSWADAFWRSSVGYFTKEDAMKKAVAKYELEIVAS